MIETARLLVIDPDPASRRARVDLLESAGWSVDAAETDFAHFRKELDRMDLATCGLVLLDAGDAGSGANTVLAGLRRKDPHLPILQIAQREHDAGTGEISADALLIRPFDRRELLSLVTTLVRLRAARRAADESETWLQLAQEAGGLALVEMCLPNRSARWSPKFAEIFRLPAAGDTENIRQRIHPEDLPHLIADYETHRRSGEPLECDFRICLPDGTIRWIAARGKVVRDAVGRADRMLFFGSDITERKESELQNAQLAAIVASSIDAIVSVGFDNRVMTWNRGAEQLFGYKAEEILGRPADVLVPEDRRAERAALMRRLHAGESIEYHTSRRRKDGQLLNVWIRGAPVLTPNGSLCCGSLIIRDVTAQHRREEHVSFLMRELTHRSKNLLAVIQAMARQTMSHLTTPEDFVARFSERLSGLAGSHDLLSSDDWVGASLVQLIRSQLQPFGDLFGSRVFLEGQDVFLRPEAAQNIGIALHELSTNAAKFGALSGPEGSVTVAWKFVPDSQGGRRLNLLWEERGGPPVRVPDHKGFGHMVMDRITGAALGGQSKVHFAPDGVTWRLDAPAAGVIRGKDDNEPRPNAGSI
ncbi:MAG: PAS domain S-box protein [Beijerinckiaceae bacterium]